jgi:putative thioredoxin
MQSTTSFDFQQDVIEQSYSKPVLVDFWAPWCAPCRTLAPVLERLAESNAEQWLLVKINTEEYPEIASEYGIRGIPNVKLFSDGSVIDEFTGALSEYQVGLWLKKALPSPWAADLERASVEVSKGHDAEAITLLEGVLGNEPDNSRAVAMLLKLTLFSRPAESLRLAEKLEGEADYADLGESVRVLGALLDRSVSDLPAGSSKDAYEAAIECLRVKDFDGALEGFIGVLREERYYDEDGSRKACIAIFRLLGEEHEITLKYRRTFDRAF